MMRTAIALALLALVLALQACGTKGGLYIPKPGDENTTRKSR